MKLNLKKTSYGIAALILLFGRYPVSWLLSSRNRNKPVPEEENNTQGQYIKSSTGNVLFVKSTGRREAQPLVFIHGINANKQQWQYLEQNFSNDYWLISIDLPGHGSSPDGRDFSIKALALDLNHILTQLNIQQPVLHGHSLGGMICQEYCKQNYLPAPKAIILQHCGYTNPLETMPFGPIPSLIQWRLIDPTLSYIARHNKFFTAMGYLAYSSGLSCLFYRLLLFKGNQSSATLRQMARSAANTTAQTAARSLMATFRFDMSKDLDKIDMPCLVIAATEDRLIAPAAGLYLHQHLNRSELAMVKGGHQSLIEYPETTIKAVQNFMIKYGIA
ncbi:alpha/beta fold hydrolase [Pedobacter petrophilus]|uniref:Alpha/beta fold hydrolase n=1 Tax=Pedobacter petrophilus TaxID=1908241 RepID=A0A7K0G1B9_9SPHI|nr:alpha/beta hydrolase [Pedobacter petrophilus]MRX77144.1 alpha/beta fold hydrolase [Pedobacter petrophilus]